MYKIRNIIIPVSREIDLKKAISRKLHLALNAIEEVEILRRSLDARQKNHLKYNLTLKADISQKIKLNNDIQIYSEPEPYITAKQELSDSHPFIVGAGPAGLFAAISLVERGFKPYIFDRGDRLAKRSKKVADFWKKGILDTESNVQFGEGGAGTFSDGKLTSRKSDYYTNQVTKYLIKFGAPQEICFEALPHLGTDGLRKIVLQIRRYLESKGCRFFWNHRLENIEIEKNRIKSVTINSEKHKPEVVILAIGNASRDTFEILTEKIEMENKPFAVGLRVEHTQDFINESFYGKNTDFSLTGPASYRLTAKDGKRGVYSFCMCPGGSVIGASSEANSIVTNGMSNSARSGKFGNSAIVVTVNENDYGNILLAGMKFQQQIERKCYNARRSYQAPAQNVDDFMKSCLTKRKLKTTFRPDVFSFELSSIYSATITNSLKTGMKVFNRRSKGFISEGVLIGPETRTSSPVRILRDSQTMSSQNIFNLFPCGEGAGYAGGIMSSAADGFKVGSIFS